MQKLLLFGITLSIVLTSAIYANLNEGKKLYSQNKFKKAQVIFHNLEGNIAKYNEANCFYKLFKYDESITIYKYLSKNINRVENKEFLFNIYFNLGNSYMQKFYIFKKNNQMSNAIDTIYLAKDSYQEAYLLNKKDKDLKINIRILQDEIKLKDIK